MGGTIRLVQCNGGSVLGALGRQVLRTSSQLRFRATTLLQSRVGTVAGIATNRGIIISPRIRVSIITLTNAPDDIYTTILHFQRKQLASGQRFLFRSATSVTTIQRRFLPQCCLSSRRVPGVVTISRLPPSDRTLRRTLGRGQNDRIRLCIPRQKSGTRLIRVTRAGTIRQLTQRDNHCTHRRGLLSRVTRILKLSEPPHAVRDCSVSG